MNRIKEFLGFGQRAEALTMEQLEARVLQSNRTKAGISVGVQDMITFAPLWKCLQMIPQDVAKCPLYLLKRRPDLGPKGRERAETNPAFMLFADYPNARQGAVEFYSQLMYHKLLYSRAIVWMDKANNGRILGLYNLLPDRTYYDPNIDKYRSQIGGGLVDFFPSEILDIKSPQSPFVNCEFAKQSREAIAVGLAAQDHSSKFLSSDCQPGGILEIPAGFAKRAKDNLERGLREKMSGNQFKTLVLGDGAKWHNAQIDAEKSQLTQTKLYSAREACMFMNVPPSRVGLPDSGGYGSRTEDNLDYRDTTIVPHLNAIASEIGLKVLTNEQKRNRSLWFEHNTDKLYTLEPKTRAEIGKIEIEAGVTSPNEYRASKNQNPRADGDLFLVHQANFIPQDSENEEPEDVDQVIEDEAVEVEGLEKPDVLEVDGPVSAQALNGAQIAGLLQVLEVVSLGNLSNDAAVKLLGIAFPTISKDQAQDLVKGAKEIKEADNVARSVLAECQKEWVEKTLGKIRKESQRKTATRFCTWFDEFLPEDYSKHFERGQKIGVNTDSQAEAFEAIKTGINELLQVTAEDDLPVKIADFCEHYQRG